MFNNFKILSALEKLNGQMDKLLPNYSKKHKVLIDNIEQSKYDMLEYIYKYAINSQDKGKRKEYINEFIVKLLMFDYFIKESKCKKCISYKQYLTLGRMVTELRMMAYGLLKSINE